MKGLLLGIIAVVLLLSVFSIPVMAQDNESTEVPVDEGEESTDLPEEDTNESEEATEEEAIEEDLVEEFLEEETGGIGPDSIFWGLERAIERIDLLLTLDKSRKAEKGLAHAQERLLEVRAMIKANKFEAAAKAEVKHNEALERVRVRLGEIKDDDPEVELEKRLRVERRLSEHEGKFKRFKLEVEIKIKGELNEEQKALLEALIASLSEETGRVRLKFKFEEGKLKIKLKAKLEKSDEEIEDLLKERRERFKELREEREDLMEEEEDRLKELREEREDRLKERMKEEVDSEDKSGSDSGSDLSVSSDFDNSGSGSSDSERKE